MEATDGPRIDRVLRTAAWGGAALLFLAPVVAEQVWAEMAWSAGDFVFWAVMLLVATGGFELAMRASSNWPYRFGAAISIGAAFLLVWVNLAVGIIGSEDNAANAMYLAVLGVGIGGALGADFKPRGLARTTTAMAVAMALAGGIALLRGWGAGTEPYWSGAVAGSTVFWGAAWLVSAWLFRRAARELTPAAALG